MTQTFEQALDAKRVELAQITDNLGTPIEAGILDTVAALQLLGFGTSGSCEGHADGGCAWPWVHVEAVAPMPEWRWEGEAEAKVKIMAELGLTEADFLVHKRRKVAKVEYNERLWDWVHAEKPSESAAYVAWCEGFHKEWMRLRALIREFEGGSRKEVFLDVSRMGGGTWARLEVVDAMTCRDDHLQGRGVQADVQVRLEVRQALMRRFTEYLMEQARAGYAG